MARTIIGDMLKDARPTFQPTARPVDTFIRPADPNETKSDALNKALASLDGAFKPALKKGQRRAVDKLKSKGEQLFQKNRKDFGDAVRDGDLPFGASPFVKKGYRRAMLHTLGATYGTELNRALEQSSLHELSDPGEVEKFIQAFNEDFHKDNNLEGIQDRELSEFYTPIVQQANDGFRRKQANENIQFTEEQRFAAFENELLAVVSMGRLEDGGTGSVDIGAWLNTKAQELYDEGGNWSDIQKTIASIIGNAASDQGSHALLDILDNVEVAGMGVMSKTVDGRKVIKAARKSILAKDRAASTKSKKDQDAEEKAQAEDLEVRATTAALVGDVDLARKLTLELAQENPVRARAVDGLMRSNINATNKSEDDANLLRVFREVQSAETSGEAQLIIDHETSLGNLDVTARNSLNSVTEDLYGDDVESKVIFQDPIFKTIESGLSKTIVGAEFQSTPEKQAKALNMSLTLKRRAKKWWQNNKDDEGQFDEDAYQDWLFEESTKLQKLYATEDDFPEKPKEETPKDKPWWHFK